MKYVVVFRNPEEAMVCPQLAASARFFTYCFLHTLFEQPTPLAANRRSAWKRPFAVTVLLLVGQSIASGVGFSVIDDSIQY